MLSKSLSPRDSASGQKLFRSKSIFIKKMIVSEILVYLMTLWPL